MSEQNNAEVSGPQLEYIDIINATKIMETAIERGVFSVKELAEVAPVVSRFQDFSQAILDEHNSNPDSSTEVEGE